MEKNRRHLMEGARDLEYGYKMAQGDLWSRVWIQGMENMRCFGTNNIIKKFSLIRGRKY